ncbi:LytTR family DNA-binding domain-containing protein [Dyadobacter sp. CY323]|uniref:LytR/AlgR family response regulator transcription factor n=1 Tax=Dyadobacter sp. CY323 TaxID=2907302 RepID=UPI001F258858|nr:LytTR family DNA-binding domain-containing protein [Dyadobacter sp. CY323]MCE6987939.1 LytTR family transcriptional regulator DNA-binding domain-containing protein [Dyadobacter sp. CY323]
MKTSISHEYLPEHGQVVRSNETKVITVFHLGRPVLVEAREIAYLEGVGNYTFICTKHNRYLLSKCLRTVQEMLNADFVRVHKSFTVNRTHIQRRNADSIQMRGGKNIPIARRRLASTHEALSTSLIF